ncbi:thiol:disulfide interchange protein DsbA/DsbL [Kushneria phosphatilytica]|uniref:Thiol:disulfide interchange protein n=1 Tax=Kushneria phosphatilytica TaxID=657387 RepID=A0A1S1NMF9_9GAMM|nr:thiol:disulfide interchange protein DsbA/DsbL [Kushneria phosphatilytica]OHV08370.1 disulfide bond formation protein DsbA [Kushneria phosphatilytica]QEL09793.1 thiol:disulfide interchange protein DsbA/DsbL [Kushneria phosphatilytica]
MLKVSRWQPLALLAGLLFSGLAMAADSNDPGYTTLDEPTQTEAPDGKIAVTEVFWYGCPHCYDLERPMEKWVRQLPDDVAFNRVPAPLGKTWAKHAAAYYTAKDLGILDKTHLAFFDAIHKQGKRMTSDDAIADFYSNYGVDRQKVLDTLNSFGVKSQLNQAMSKVKSWQVMGTPTIVVAGKYTVTPQSAQGIDNMLDVTDRLISKVREQRSHQSDQSSN